MQFSCKDCLSVLCGNSIWWKENIICAFYDEVFIIEKNGDKVNYIKIDMNFNLFRKNIIDGIEMYLNEWIDWNMEDDINTLKNRKEELKTKLITAKEYLKN